jgi:hypothetical protein
MVLYVILQRLVIFYSNVKQSNLTKVFLGLFGEIILSLEQEGFG